MARREAALRFQAPSRNSAAANGSASASPTTVPAFPITSCQKSSCHFSPPSLKARVWGLPWYKKWRSSIAGASKRAMPPAEEPNSCSGYLCGRRLRRRSSPPLRTASKLIGPYVAGVASQGGVAMRKWAQLTAVAVMIGFAGIGSAPQAAPQNSEQAKPASPAAAPQDSLAEAARKARERKKEEPAPTKVF